MGKDFIQAAEKSLEDDAQVRVQSPIAHEDNELNRISYRYILDNQGTIARIACLDSGKTPIDASLGEILVTVEKLKWTIQHGENALQPERRPTNFLMMYKHNEVRWEPLGILAACVSWKYALFGSLFQLRTLTDQI